MKHWSVIANMEMAMTTNTLSNSAVRELHLRKAGGRLWTTGGYSEVRAREWCADNGLDEVETRWVLDGRAAAEARDR
jgi:hypothetical protein